MKTKVVETVDNNFKYQIQAFLNDKWVLVDYASDRDHAIEKAQAISKRSHLNLDIAEFEDGSQIV
jgi:hypothetical protein